MAVYLADLPLTPPVVLAPMAGITDRPFRDLVASFGAGLVVSEMIASREMIAASPSARARAELGFGAAATAVQIAGNAADLMAEAARMAEAEGARIIDINMGCPAKKVTGAASGSALLRDLDHATRLIEAVVDAVDVPVTLKTRLGWDDTTLNAATLARRAEAAGVAMITIHGRTRCQFYKGAADWAAIRAITDAVAIPVLANGDITDAATARAALDASGAQGVMVGRGIQGRPWALAEIAHALYDTLPVAVPQGEALIDLVAAHYEAMLAFYGRDLGVRVARKHLGCYMDDAATPAPLRRAVLTARDPSDVLRALPEALRPRAPETGMRAA